MEITRGMIIWADTPKIESGSIQTGIRPYLIISNDMCNKYSSVLTGIPITSSRSKMEKSIPTHVKFMFKKESVILCEQITSINRLWIKNHERNLERIKVSEDILKEVEKCLRVQIGIDKQKQSMI